MKKSIIIGITGPSGSGKSLFSESVCKIFKEDKLNKIAIVREDGYYIHSPELSFEERSLRNYDHPDAFEHSLLIEHLMLLQKGNAIKTPLYNYKTHLREDSTMDVYPAPVIIVEGILLLQDERLRGVIDIKIYMDSPLDICLARRIYRDSVERGRDVSSVITQYNNHVRPMYFKYIEPSRRHADIIVPKGGKNKIAIDIIESKIKNLI